MKPQDILFLLVFIFIASRKNLKLSTLVGIGCLIVAMLLFSRWVFFTAEHLAWYAAAFFLLAIIQGIWSEIHAQEELALPKKKKSRNKKK